MEIACYSNRSISVTIKLTFSCFGIPIRERIDLTSILNDQIDQAWARVEAAFTNLEVASKELHSLCEQKKSLTSSSISGVRYAIESLICYSAW